MHFCIQYSQNIDICVYFLYPHLIKYLLNEELMASSSTPPLNPLRRQLHQESMYFASYEDAVKFLNEDKSNSKLFLLRPSGLSPEPTSEDKEDLLGVYVENETGVTFPRDQETKEHPFVVEYKSPDSEDSTSMRFTLSSDHSVQIRESTLEEIAENKKWSSLREFIAEFLALGFFPIIHSAHIAFAANPLAKEVKAPPSPFTIEKDYMAHRTNYLAALQKSQDRVSDLNLLALNTLFNESVSWKYLPNSKDLFGQSAYICKFEGRDINRCEEGKSERARFDKLFKDKLGLGIGKDEMRELTWPWGYGRAVSQTVLDKALRETSNVEVQEVIKRLSNPSTHEPDQERKPLRPA